MGIRGAIELHYQSMSFAVAWYCKHCVKLELMVSVMLAV